MTFAGDFTDVPQRPMAITAADLRIQITFRHPGFDFRYRRRPETKLLAEWPRCCTPPPIVQMLAAIAERQKMTRAWAAHDAETYRPFVEAVTGFTGRSLADLRVLDLGCGSNAPMSIMLHASGCRVVGVDSRVGHQWGLGFRLSRHRSHLREVGVIKALRKAAGELVFDRVYYLANLTGLRLTDKALDLRAMDIQTLDLPDESFDVIHSNATWEHLGDVVAANRAVARCLSPGGLAYIEIHLFPSLSGGHDLPWIVPGRTVLNGVRPWQHLRDPQWQAPVFLNRLREHEYRRAFEDANDLVIERWDVEFSEAQEFLSADVLEELPDYSTEEMTKRSIVVIARKRAL